MSRSTKDLPILRGVVRDLGAAGDAVVDTELGVIFAAHGLPGEEVALSHVSREGRHPRARLVVLRPSDERVAAACGYAEACGGCALMISSDAFEGGWKAARVARALARATGGRAADVSMFQPDAKLGYRRRARLAFRRQSGVGLIGFRARFSHRLVDIPQCVVLRPELNDILTRLRESLLPLLEGEGEVRLALGAEGRPTLALDVESVPERGYRLLERWVAEGTLAGALLTLGGVVIPHRIGDPTERTFDIDGRELLGTEGGFSQAHDETNRVLGASVIELAQPAGKRVLELYAGHGNLTLPLASRAQTVIAVELSAPAVAALRRNAAHHQLSDRVDARVAPAHEAVPRQDVDVVVLDPPRTGAREAIEPLVRLGAKTIVYVSCNPDTLARDVELLSRAGYRFDAARAFDMFPRTAHVEAVVRLVR